MKPFIPTYLMRFLTAAVLSLVLAVLFVGCGTAGAGEPPAEPDAAASLTRVRTVAVEADEEAHAIRASGHLAPKTEARLSFKIDGIIDEILVDEGEAVQQGQVLARLRLTEIDAQVAAARSAAEKARRDYDRMERLYRDSVVTLAQMQDARTGLETSQATLDRAVFNRRHAEIVAPQAGPVLRRLAEANEYVSPGTPVVVLGGVGEGWVVRVGLADRDVVRLRLGDRAAVTLDAFPGRTFEGRVAEIAEAADPQSGTFEVEVHLPDPSGRLKAGFVARVMLYPASSGTHVRVPIEALVEGDGANGVVFTLEPGTDRVRRTPVQIAEVLDNAVLVHSGLAVADEVVTDGAAYLADGDQVKRVGTVPGPSHQE